MEKNILENKGIFFFTKQTKVNTIIQFYDEIEIRTQMARICNPCPQRE